jgi:hypothetical protein
LIVVALLAWHTAPAQDVANKAEASAPTRAEVREALDRVAKDPNLATERTARTLRWADKRDESRERPAWLQSLIAVVRFVRGLFGWVASSARVLLWVAAAILAGLLAVFVLRLLGERRGVLRLPRSSMAPSHVRDLDIRPESLPEDVGAAAAALWDRGEHRAALALLYRALLSRLVHDYRVPIQKSSTEGDCLALALPRLAVGAGGYTTRLISVWQNAVYGGLLPTGTAVHALCAEFGTLLGAPAAQRYP